MGAAGDITLLKRYRIFERTQWQRIFTINGFIRWRALPPPGCVATSLAVNSIGQGLALARGRLPKHAIKQVDRLLSNPGIDVDELSKRWVAHAVGPRPKIVAALDWTDFDADNQATIMLSLVTNHGRSTPLVWLTVDKATLKNHRSAYEYRVLVQALENAAVTKVRSWRIQGSAVRSWHWVLNEEVEIRLSDTLPRQYRRDLSRG